jgi:hypothetical protein
MAELKTPLNLRTVSRVRLNVYDGDRPVCQCHTAEDAAELVLRVNRDARCHDALVAALTDLLNAQCRCSSCAESRAAKQARAALALAKEAKPLPKSCTGWQ